MYVKYLHGKQIAATFTSTKSGVLSCKRNSNYDEKEIQNRFKRWKEQNFKVLEMTLQFIIDC